MKRLLIPFAALLLAACSQGTVGPTGGGRPALPSDSVVSFPAPLGGDHLYLSLLDDQGHTLYQVSVPGTASSVSVTPTDWMTKQSQLSVRPLSELLPPDASDVMQSNPDAQGALLTWTVWRDTNTNGVLDPGEALPLMTHDYVVYATSADTVTFKTINPEMQQSWTVTAGWSRGEHYVYLPRSSGSYLRSVTSTQDYHFGLHVPTPDSSM